MKFYQATKVVIVTEEIIVDTIIKIISDFGINGYTLQDVSGKGEKGIRTGNGLSGMLKNVRIETITSEDNAKKIAVEMIEKIFINYAGIVYLENVKIIRAHKFHLPE